MAGEPHPIQFRSDVTVELVRAAAKDADVLFAARVSTQGEQSLDGVNADAAGSQGLINYLMRDRHGCYDSETEVLTSDGWKSWPAVDGTELFATLSADDRIEYQAPERVIHKDYDGPMVRVSMAQLDLLVTPDHNLLAKRRRQPHKESYELVPAADLLEASHRIPLCGGVWGFRVHPAYPPGFLALLGFFIGDGHSGGGTPTFRLRKQRERHFLLTAAQEAGFEVTFDGVDRYYLRASEEFRLLAKKCYDDDGSKIIPRELLYRSSDELECLLDGLMHSDGSVSPTGKMTYSTTSATLAGQLQEVALKTGRAALVYDHPFDGDPAHLGSKPRYRVTLYRPRNSAPRVGWTRESRERQVTVEQYRGQVHCVTVPNGTLYVRRSGKPAWCGNSPFEHNSMTFYVQAPIFVFREFMRHRIGFCLAGDTEVTFQSESGLLRRDRIDRLHDRWHNGVTDHLPFSRGEGVTRLAKSGKWQGQVRSGGAVAYLGLFDVRQDAIEAVRRFREDNPTVRRRLLPSVRQQHVRCYNEETLRPERGRILDVIESGVKPLIRIETESGVVLRCTREHRILTPDGWCTAGDLTVGNHVMATGRRGVSSEGLVPPSLRRGIGVWTSMQRSKRIAPLDACYRCGVAFPREQLALDHVVPVAADLRRALDEDNLKPCCEPCHRQKTNLEQALARRGGSTAAAVPVVITSIRDDGDEMTYDLSVDGPWHNFLANGIVVHNSYNEESGRYRELRPVFYVPGSDRKLVQDGKPGHYVFLDGTTAQHAVVEEQTRTACTAAYEAYQRMLSAGVAREVARGVLPVATYSSMYTTLNARSLMSFLSLRTKREDSHFPSYPQREIEMVAEKLELFWAELMPLTHAAFEASGRVAP